MIAGAFELSHLPNRVEMRLKSTGRVIGYTLSHVRAADGTRSGIALFFKDLTRVEQLEERERLRDRLAALGEMAAAIAHELKNPLAGIEVMAGLLRRKVPESPDAQSILTDIINEAKMANATVVEVLDYVRPVRLETERTSIADVMHAALAIAEGKAPRGGVQVHTRIAERPAIRPRRSSPALSGVHEPPDQRIRGARRQRSIRMSAEQSAVEGDHAQPDSPAQVATVVVQVSDDGPGLPPEMVDRIFNPFFTTKAQGSGLGLAIVRKIVDAHDGRIDVSSVAGLGTRFTVTLPVVGGHQGPFGTAPAGD